MKTFEDFVLAAERSRSVAAPSIDVTVRVLITLQHAPQRILVRNQESRLWWSCVAAAAAIAAVVAGLAWPSLDVLSDPTADWIEPMSVALQ